MTDTVTPTLGELEQQYLDARANPDVSAEDLLNLGLAINKAKTAVERSEREAANAQAKAEHDAKMSEINPLMETAKASFELLIEEVQKGFAKAGITELRLTVTNLQDEKPQVGVKCAGPGLPAAKKSAGTGSGTGTKRGRNVYEFEGTVYSSRELLERFGQEHFGDKYLDPTGFSHRADALAEKIKAVKTKRENGDS